MNDTIFIFFTIFIITGLIYFLYKVMLGSEKKEDANLQITSEEILQQVTILYKQKKYAIAENLARKYLEKKPKDDKVRMVLAKSLLSEKKVYDAAEQAKIIVKHQPTNSDAKIFLANCYIKAEKHTQAIETLNEVLEEDYNNIIAIKELAEVYYETHQKQSAIKMYQRLYELLENNQEKVKTKSKMAEIYMSLKDFKSAIGAYEEILAIYPDDTDATKKITELYKITGDYDSAITLATSILNRYSNDANSLWAMESLESIHFIMQNYEKALEYAYLTKEHPLSDKKDAEEIIAKIFLEKGEVNNSIELLKELVKQNPEDINLKKNLAKSYETNKEFEQAVDLYKQILDEATVSQMDKIHFEISTLYSNWAMNLFMENDNTECFKKLTLALQYCNKNPEVYYRLGNINKDIKNYNEAISQYKKAIDLDGKNYIYYDAIAECYKGIDSVYEEKKALIESLKYNPANAVAHYRIGLILKLQNDSNNAIMHLKQAMELDDNFIDAKHQLALLYEHCGNKEDAIRVYENILKFEPENIDIINNLKMLKSH